jgi:HK97 family phage portal protein
MLFRKKSEKRSFTLEDESLLKALGIDIDGISSNKAKEATVFACLRILTDSVSKLPLKLYKETDEGIEKASKHYLYTKLKLRPNKNMSSSDFWKTVQFQLSYFGHSVVVIETLPNGKVANLHPLDMSKVKIWIDDKAIIGKESSIWYVYDDGKNGIRFSSEEVLHFKGMTNDGLTGMAIKDYLKINIENLQYGSDYINKTFKNGLSVKGILSFTGDLDNNGMIRMQEKFNKMATGMTNIGKILPVPPGYNFSTITSSMADAQFLELNKLSIQQIASAFGIKMHQINDLSGAKFNNVTSQNEEFYRDTLQSILTMYEQELTWKLLTEREIKSGHFFEFNVDSILRADLKTRYEAYGIGIDKGFLMPSEARQKENLSIAKGADRLIVNGTMQPLDQVGMAYKPPTENVSTEGGDNDEQ